MKPHESPRIKEKSIRGDPGDSWPVWNRGIRYTKSVCDNDLMLYVCVENISKKIY